MEEAGRATPRGTKTPQKAAESSQSDDFRCNRLAPHALQSQAVLRASADRAAEQAEPVRECCAQKRLDSNPGVDSVF